MQYPLVIELQRVKRVRAILLTGHGSLLFIKRIKPNKPAPYWVAPGGGMEDGDDSLQATLRRELCEELGATVQVVRRAFMLVHQKGGKDLEEHFYVCRLLSYDLSQRHGPEFEDPARGLYIPDEIPLTAAALRGINIKTPQLRDYILRNLHDLRGESCA
jgi:8-oxo-dGTP pyrophosphatase MutT (NUDIX family)